MLKLRKSRTNANKERGVIMNTLKLKAKFVEKQMNVSDVADALGINRSTLYRKLSNLEEFTVKQVCLLKEKLELTPAELTEIFFIQTVA